MSNVTHETLNRRAEEIADLLDDLPWCECDGYFILEQEDELTEPAHNSLLQAFDVFVYDGYVTDFMRMVHSLHDTLLAQFGEHDVQVYLSVPYLACEDPNHVPLTMKVNYHGPEDGFHSARQEVIDAFQSIVQEAIDEWSQEEEEDEEPTETLV